MRVPVIPGSGGRRMFAASLAMPAPGLSGGLSARRARPLCPRSRRIAVSQQTTFRAKVQNALQQERVYFEHLVGVHTRGSRWVIARRPRCEPAPAHRCRGCLASALERHYGPPLVLLQRHVRQVLVKLHLLRRRGIHVVGHLDPGIHGVGVCLYRSVHLVDVANIVVEVVGAWRVRRP